jgi:hypothetical protein
VEPVALDDIVAALFELTDVELSGLAEAVAAEQRTRAADSGDLGALIEEGFRLGFDGRGMAKGPWVTSGVIVCPGAKVGMGSTHKCRFVAVGDSWVWESRDVLRDDVRQLDGRTNTVTLVAAVDGLELWSVVSKARNGRHERQQADGYVVRGGELVVTEIRSKLDRPHR